MSRKCLIKFLFLSLLLTFPLISFAKKVENTRNNSVSKNLITTSPAQNEVFVLSLMRSWYDIQATYYNGVGNGNFGDFDSLQQAGLIDGTLATGFKYGYLFSWTLQTGSLDVPATFSFRAMPMFYGKTGRKSFYIDTKCEIRVTSDGTEANQNSPILETCTPYLAIQSEQRQFATMRSLASAEETYRATVGAGNYAGSLANLYSVGLINQRLSSSYYEYYYFTGGATPGTATTPPLFFYRCNPLIYGISGFKSFYIDQSGVLRGADHQGGDANENDPPVE